MPRITSYRTLTSTALALLLLGAPAAVLADPGPPAATPAFARQWLQGLWSWLGGPSEARAGGRTGDAAAAALHRGAKLGQGSGLRALPQADGSFIDPNGGKTPLPPPPPHG